MSTIDSTYVIAGALTAAQYFHRDTENEREIRRLAEAIYRRADWHWAQNGGDTVTHGWTPERGFIKYRWEGYSEALILYVLGLASPTHPLPEKSYQAWTSTYDWKSLYGYEFVYAGPLFIHQLSHMWIDFRGIQDEYLRHKGIDYFENGRRATYIQQQYPIRNPRGFSEYGEFIWGLTASDRPAQRLKSAEARSANSTICSIVHQASARAGLVSVSLLTPLVSDDVVTSFLKGYSYMKGFCGAAL